MAGCQEGKGGTDGREGDTDGGVIVKERVSVKGKGVSNRERECVRGW